MTTCESPAVRVSEVYENPTSVSNPVSRVEGLPGHREHSVPRTHMKVDAGVHNTIVHILGIKNGGHSSCHGGYSTGLCSVQPPLGGMCRSGIGRSLRWHVYVHTDYMQVYKVVTGRCSGEQACRSQGCGKGENPVARPNQSCVPEDAHTHMARY